MSSTSPTIALLAVAFAGVLLCACGEQFSSGSDAGTTTTSGNHGGSGGNGQGGSGPGGNVDTGGQASGGGTAGANTAGGPAQSLRVFVTDTPVPGGTFLGPDGVDANCGTVALAAGLGGIWTAWLSTNDNGIVADAIDRIVGTGPWIRIDGEPAFENRAQLTIGPSAPIDCDQYGTQVDDTINPNVWTGTSVDGTSTGLGTDCYAWAISTSGHVAEVGAFAAAALGPDWTQTGLLACDKPARFYCFENGTE
jgi:hypothetical protein